MSAVAQAATLTPPARREATAVSQCLLLHDVPWANYMAIGNALPDRPRLRMTYDRGTLEIMMISPLHEMYKKRLGRLVETMAEELELPLDTAGSMTFQREDLERALEGDDCFWIAHERQMRGKRTWHPDVDPPPDLVLEIEISRSALDRMAIYAALQVPEVWCFDGLSLRIFVLQPDQTYLRADRSTTFPTIPIEGIVPFIEPQEGMDYLGMVRAFREWLRQAPGK